MFGVTVIALALANVGASQAHPARMGAIRVELTGASRAAPGTKIYVTVRIQNETDEVIQIPRVIEPSGQWLLLSAKDEKGAPLKILGSQGSVASGSGGAMSLYPDCFWGRALEVGSIFDLSRPGRYVIGADVILPPGGKGPGLQKITASPIEVVVEPKTH